MYYIGLDIGGTKCASVLAEETGDKITFLSREEFATSGTWQSVLDRLCANALRQAADAGVLNGLKACGISCGGPLDVNTGYILSPPNLPGWDNVPVTEYVSQRLKVKTRLNNDADACAVAEWRYGAGRGARNMIFLTFGTGLGAGLILGGRLYTGTNGMAGEAGHIRLEKDGPTGYNKSGSFEGFCSGGGIAQIAKSKARELLAAGAKASYCKNGIENITTKDVALAAEAGHADAKEVFALSGRYFGKGLAVLIDILNPELIVAGSVFARAGKFMVDAMNEELKREALPQSLAVCKIVPAKLGDNIGDYACIVTAVSDTI